MLHVHCHLVGSLVLLKSLYPLLIHNVLPSYLISMFYMSFIHSNPCHALFVSLTLLSGFLNLCIVLCVWMFIMFMSIHCYYLLGVSLASWVASNSCISLFLMSCFLLHTLHIYTTHLYDMPLPCASVTLHASLQDTCYTGSLLCPYFWGHVHE